MVHFRRHIGARSFSPIFRSGLCLAMPPKKKRRRKTVLSGMRVPPKGSVLDHLLNRWNEPLLGEHIGKSFAAYMARVAMADDEPPIAIPVVTPLVGCLCVPCFVCGFCRAQHAQHVDSGPLADLVPTDEVAACLVLSPTAEPAPPVCDDHDNHELNGEPTANVDISAAETEPVSVSPTTHLESTEHEIQQENSPTSRVSDATFVYATMADSTPECMHSPATTLSRDPEYTYSHTPTPPESSPPSNPTEPGSETE